MTIRYYEAMWSGELGFKEVFRADSDPRLFGIRIGAVGADESWSLYDHPPVSIFRKQRTVTETEVHALLEPHLEHAQHWWLPQPTLVERGVLGLVGIGLGLLAGERAGDSTPDGPEPDSRSIRSSAGRILFGPPTGLGLDHDLIPAPLVGPLSIQRTREPECGPVHLWWLAGPVPAGPDRLAVSVPAAPGPSRQGVDAGPTHRLAGSRHSGVVAGARRHPGVHGPGALDDFAAALRPGGGQCLAAAHRLPEDAQGALADAPGGRNRGVAGRARHVGPAPGQSRPLASMGRRREIHGHCDRETESWPVRSFRPSIPTSPAKYINYYYFGQYLVAFLAKLTGIWTEVFYNVALVIWFAMTVQLAWAAGFYFHHARIGSPEAWRVALRRGLWAPFLLVGIGNPAAALMQLDVWRSQTKGMIPELLDAWVWPVRVGAAVLAGVLDDIRHGVIAPHDWWASSRTIPATITEFPYWSFLFGDPPCPPPGASTRNRRVRSLRCRPQLRSVPPAGGCPAGVDWDPVECLGCHQPVGAALVRRIDRHNRNPGLQANLDEAPMDALRRGSGRVGNGSLLGVDCRSGARLN